MSKPFKPQHHIEATFHLYASRDSGRNEPVESGFSPQHRTHDNNLVTGRHIYPDVEQVSLGSTVKTLVRLVASEKCPHSFWIGREIDVVEGQKVIGRMKITKILCNRLVGTAATHTPLLISKSPGTDKQTRKSYFPLLTISAMYAFITGKMLLLGIDVNTPCLSNFEGGCSMGKAYLGIVSLFLAAFSAGLAVGAKNVLASLPRTEHYAKKVGLALIGIPIIYIAITPIIVFR